MLAPSTKLGARIPPALPEPRRGVNKELKSHVSRSVRDAEDPAGRAAPSWRSCSRQRAFSETAGVNTFCSVVQDGLCGHPPLGHWAGSRCSRHVTDARATHAGSSTRRADSGDVGPRATPARTAGSASREQSSAQGCLRIRDVRVGRDGLRVSPSSIGNVSNTDMSGDVGRRSSGSEGGKNHKASLSVSVLFLCVHVFVFTWSP